LELWLGAGKIDGQIALAGSRIAPIQQTSSGLVLASRHFHSIARCELASTNYRPTMHENRINRHVAEHQGRYQILGTAGPLQRLNVKQGNVGSFPHLDTAQIIASQAFCPASRCQP
jgi:hypothetical protein